MIRRFVMVLAIVVVATTVSHPAYIASHDSIQYLRESFIG